MQWACKLPRWVERCFWVSSYRPINTSTYTNYRIRAHPIIRNFKQIKKVQTKSKRRRKHQNALQPIQSIKTRLVWASGSSTYPDEFWLVTSVYMPCAGGNFRPTNCVERWRRCYLRGGMWLGLICHSGRFLLRRCLYMPWLILEGWKWFSLTMSCPLVCCCSLKKLTTIVLSLFSAASQYLNGIMEMQLNQLKKEDNDFIWKQLLPKTYYVFGFCIKKYYLFGRQSMKRTTTYSGNLHAFNAQLQTDAMLKRGWERSKEGLELKQ